MVTPPVAKVIAEKRMIAMAEDVEVALAVTTTDNEALHIIAKVGARLLQVRP